MLTKVVGRRYCIVDQLGDGGFSQTYIAKDKDLPNEPHCVVKQFKPQSTDPDPFKLQTARRLFATEATILQKLGKHNQIPQLLAYIEQDGDFYLVEELIEGNNLSQELKAGKQLSESHVINLLQDILQILKFIHQHNVIHRDLKPSNLILRQSDKKIVLIDFGAVKEIANISSISDDEENKSFTIAIGTPGYMPSEQSYGRPNFSSDIYAAGAIAIQALTGIRPLLLSRDYNDEFVWSEQGNVSDKLKHILTKMVRYHSKQRYQSATEVLEDLDQLTHISPVISWNEQTSKEEKSRILLEMEEKFTSQQSENSKSKNKKNLLQIEEELNSKQSNKSRSKQAKSLLEIEEELNSKQTKKEYLLSRLNPNIDPKIFLNRLRLEKI